MGICCWLFWWIEAAWRSTSAYEGQKDREDFQFGCERLAFLGWVGNDVVCIGWDRPTLREWSEVQHRTAVPRHLLAVKIPWTASLPVSMLWKVWHVPSRKGLLMIRSALSPKYGDNWDLAFRKKASPCECGHDKKFHAIGVWACLACTWIGKEASCPKFRLKTEECECGHDSRFHIDGQCLACAQAGREAECTVFTKKDSQEKTK